METRRARPIVLLAALLALPSAGSDAGVTYRLEVANTWSETTHPGAFPPDAHFSWFGGATHDDGVRFWTEGEPATPGMTRMAEDGTTFLLLEEVAATAERGHVGGPLSYQWWFCPVDIAARSCGERTVEFEIEEEFPLVTLVSMLGPSPDWFVGVSGLPLRESGRWLPEVVVDLRPYDGGSRSANRWQLFGPQNMPPEPIRRITEASGELVGPGSLGSFTFTLLTRLFVRGDADGNGRLEIADPIRLLHFLFLGSEDLPCADAADTDDDGTLAMADALQSLTFQFADGPPPPAPFPEAGTDPTGDGLGCG